MGKEAFLEQLRKCLRGLPQKDLEEQLAFYSEMIDDRIEEGLTEEEAVSAVGSVEAIAAQTVAEIPLTKLATERIRPKRRLKAWEIVLLVLGSPVWLSVLIAALAVILSVYISLWAVIIALWAVFASVAACAFGGIAAGIVFICCGKIPAGIAMIGGAFVCGGLAIFLFYGCCLETKGTVLLAKMFLLWIKRRFIRKEDA